MPRRETKEVKSKKISRKKEEEPKVKKKAAKAVKVAVKKEKMKAPKKNVVDIGEMVERFNKEPEEIMEPLEVNYEKIERDKRMIMWSGVTFFMIMILFVWVWNIKSVFSESAREMGNSNFSWQDISKEMNKTMDEVQDNIAEIKETASSTMENVQANGQPATNETSATSTLPVNENVGGNAATSTINQVNEEDISELKKKIEELEERLNTN